MTGVPAHLLHPLPAGWKLFPRHGAWPSAPGLRWVSGPHFPPHPLPPSQCLPASPLVHSQDEELSVSCPEQCKETQVAGKTPRLLKSSGTSSQQKQTSSEVIAGCSLPPLREMGPCLALGSPEGLELSLLHQHHRQLLSAGGINTIFLPLQTLRL